MNSNRQCTVCLPDVGSAGLPLRPHEGGGPVSFRYKDAPWIPFEDVLYSTCYGNFCRCRLYTERQKTGYHVHRLDVQKHDLASVLRLSGAMSYSYPPALLALSGTMMHIFAILSEPAPPRALLGTENMCWASTSERVRAKTVKFQDSRYVCAIANHELTPREHQGRGDLPRLDPNRDSLPGCLFVKQDHWGIRHLLPRTTVAHLSLSCYTPMDPTVWWEARFEPSALDDKELKMSSFRCYAPGVTGLSIFWEGSSVTVMHAHTAGETVTLSSIADSSGQRFSQPVCLHFPMVAGERLDEIWILHYWTRFDTSPSPPALIFRTDHGHIWLEGEHPNAMWTRTRPRLLDQRTPRADRIFYNSTGRDTFAFTSPKPAFREPLVFQPATVPHPVESSQKGGYFYSSAELHGVAEVIPCFHTKTRKRLLSSASCSVTRQRRTVQRAWARCDWIGWDLRSGSTQTETPCGWGLRGRDRERCVRCTPDYRVLPSREKR
ncbi:hypothetical protein VTK73DRAFT_6092 [Phialemonium thermophilum]|uniref:Uncharacterized protein n=1 Tax=Phialemonium thermophilum TaxID=223376 RepID=A0ABR3WKM0_9PEZI